MTSSGSQTKCVHDVEPKGFATLTRLFWRNNETLATNRIPRKKHGYNLPHEILIRKHQTLEPNFLEHKPNMEPQHQSLWKETTSEYSPLNFPYIFSCPSRFCGRSSRYTPPTKSTYKNLRSGIFVVDSHLGSETVRLVKRRKGSSRPLPFAKLTRKKKGHVMGATCHRSSQVKTKQDISHNSLDKRRAA